MVHGYFCAKLFTKIGGIARMVKISMSYYDEIETSRLTARACQFFFQSGALT